jgi:hypothetical protein
VFHVLVVVRSLDLLSRQDLGHSEDSHTSRDKPQGRRRDRTACTYLIAVLDKVNSRARKKSTNLSLGQRSDFFLGAKHKLWGRKKKSNWLERAGEPRAKATKDRGRDAEEEGQGWAWSEEQQTTTIAT